MAILIETCPNCGHDLIDICICTYPPIPKKQCLNCGWFWEGKAEEVVMVSFQEEMIFKEQIMTEEQIELLKKALELYDFIIEQRREDRYDNEEANAFYWMREKLSELIGIDVT